MMKVANKTIEIENCTSDPISQDVLASDKPVILKNLASNWELVKNQSQSSEQAIEYLQTFDQGKSVGVFSAGPEIRGRYFYNQDLTGFNFETHKMPLSEVLNQIKKHLDNDSPPAIYVGSTTVDACLPGFRKNNDLSLENINPLVSIWFGNPSRIACHYDAPNNIACSLVGKRKFTLFPPEQIQNLYPGPIDFTPAGQAVSMVDFAAPDLTRYPRFRDALNAGQVAELDPGDALFIPSLWWHHVEGLSPFNVLINYWWRNSPQFMGQPMSALHHGLLSIRDLPEAERQAWKHIFDYYLFGPTEIPRQHLPDHNRGLLEPMNDNRSRQLRTLLINMLNR